LSRAHLGEETSNEKEAGRGKDVLHLIGDFGGGSNSPSQQIWGACRTFASSKGGTAEETIWRKGLALWGTERQAKTGTEMKVGRGKAFSHQSAKLLGARRSGQAFPKGRSELGKRPVGKKAPFSSWRTGTRAGVLVRGLKNSSEKERRFEFSTAD